jgi:hypothetical protein
MAKSKIKSDSIDSIDAVKITTGTISTARLGSGTASSSTFLRGDNTFATPAGGQITDSTVFFENWNTISSNQTTNLSSSKNMFVMGSISVTGSAVWTVSGTGSLNII